MKARRSIGKLQRWKIERARVYRANPTPPERILWDKLKAKQTGHKFRRQSPIVGYLADFYCPKRALVVEVDGKCHDARKALDRARDDAMTRAGIRTILRIPARDVFQNVDSVMSKIIKALDSD